MPVILVGMVVDMKRICSWKKWRAEEEERQKGSLTPPPPPKKKKLTNSYLLRLSYLNISPKNRRCSKSKRP
jgi:hypothetical protein